MSLRRPLQLALAALLLLTAFVGGVAVWDRLTAPEPYTFEPVFEPTALDEPEGEAIVERLLESRAAEAPPPGEGGDREAPADPCTPPARWIVMGWDGASWDVLLPLLEAGEMPHLAGLLANGVHGELATFRPTLSPAVWTTVATGVSPAEHGILGFYNQKPRFERWLERLRNFGRLERHLFSNADRRAPAAWNILPEYGHRVMVVGYHNTFPVEPVDGVMVSNYLAQDHIGDLVGADGVAGSEFADALVHPADHLDRVMEIQRRVEAELPEAIRELVALEPGEVDAYLEAAQDLEEGGDQRPDFATRAWAFDAAYVRTALALYPEVDPDVLFLHTQAIDWASHYFLWFHDRSLFEGIETGSEEWRALEAQQERYGDTVRAFHHLVDGWLGRLLALRGPDTAVMVLSDHGFQPEADPHRTGFHDDAPPGVLVIEGPGIATGRRLRGATIYDVLPTLFGSLDIPLAETLEGRVLDEAFCGAGRRRMERPRRVESYAAGPFVPRVARPAGLEQDLLDQLESLGYLD